LPCSGRSSCWRSFPRIRRQVSGAICARTGRRRRPEWSFAAFPAGHLRPFLIYETPATFFPPRLRHRTRSPSRGSDRGLPDTARRPPPSLSLPGSSIGTQPIGASPIASTPIASSRRGRVATPPAWMPYGVGPARFCIGKRLRDNGDPRRPPVSSCLATPFGFARPSARGPIGRVTLTPDFQPLFTLAPL